MNKEDNKEIEIPEIINSQEDQKDVHNILDGESIHNMTGFLAVFNENEYFIAGSTVSDTSDKNYTIHSQYVKEQSKQYLQGTMMGVFFPVFNNIVGVIPFLEQPSLTGYAGLGEMLLIIFLCFIITFITTLSLSALVTNGKMKAGGIYYIFTRIFGTQLGSAVGLCFWFAVSLSAAQYIIGAVQTYILVGGQQIVEGVEKNVRILGFLALVFLLFINAFGIKYVSMAGIFFLSFVGLGVLMIYISIFNTAENPLLNEHGNKGFNGLNGDTCRANWGNSYSKYSFFQVFGIYFPTMTGIEAGVNRSGDLIDPSRSIPRGTLAAQIITSIIYLSISVMYGCSADRATLIRQDIVILTEIAWPHKYFMALAMILCSVGSALENLVGAPRMLLSIATDGNFKFLDYFKNRFNLLMILNAGIAFAGIMAAKLEIINPILSMFYLIPYGMICFAVLMSDFVALPSWRPTFKYYNQFLCFIGFALSAFMMVLIGQFYILAAIFFQILIFYYVKNQVGQSQENEESHNYGNIFAGLCLKIGQSITKLVHRVRYHPKLWSPDIIIPGHYSEPEKFQNEGALYLASTMRKNTNIIFYLHLHKSGFNSVDFETIKSLDKQCQTALKKRHLDILPQFIQYDYDNGYTLVLQAMGFSVLPNIVFTCFPESQNIKDEKAYEFIQLIQECSQLQQSIAVIQPSDAFVIEDQVQFNGMIDVYCFSYQNGLILLIAEFIRQSDQWKKCKVRVFIMNSDSIQGLTQQQGNKIQENNEKVESAQQTQQGVQIKIQDSVTDVLKRHRLLLDAEIKVISLNYLQIRDLIFHQQEQELRRGQYQDWNQSSDPKFDQPTVSKYLIDDRPENDKNNQQETKQRQNSNQFDDQKVPNEKGSLINQIILENSQASDLVIINLPPIWRRKEEDYLNFLRSLTNGIQRVIFVKNKQDISTEFL